MSLIVNDTRNASPNSPAPPDSTPEAAAVTPSRKPCASKTAAKAAQQAPKTDRPAPQTRRRTRLAAGIYKDRWGLSATVKVNGIQREIRFDPGTPLKPIRARRDELGPSLRTLPRAPRQTLALRTHHPATTRIYAVPTLPKQLDTVQRLRVLTAR